ncbi:hypothetical protein ACN28E_21200 [Archangium lansingense]|uniref:hypothetical protein n=1 Tax=Archangium lansingense TaxID=2995310 RepID=UPI003B7DAAEE
MGIVSIGEVVGSVQGGPSEQEQSPSEEARAQQQGAAPNVPPPDDLERELRVRAWRRTRLHAD